MERFYNAIISCFTRSFSDWCLTGETLAYFMCNYSLRGCRRIVISAVGDCDILDNTFDRAGLKKVSYCRYASADTEVEIRLVKELAGTMTEFPIDYDRWPLRFPRNIGTILDDTDIRWTEDTLRLPYQEVPGAFFDANRRKEGHEFIGKMLECGERAGIRSKMFLAFGNLLGYALRKDFMPKDSDIDMCILADDVPQEQRHQYLMECRNIGLTENRMRGPVSIDGKYVWFSIGPKSITEEHGVKSCNWFWFKHGGYFWHSKGKQWIGRAGLSDKHSTAKGITSDIFTGDMRFVDFGGNKIIVPKNVGKCLDFWYGDWLHRRGGSSNIVSVLVMPDEKNRSTWYIENK